MNNILEFKLYGTRFGISIDTIDKIIEYRGIRTFPKMGNHIEGLIVYQNDMIPVIDLSGYFQLNQTENHKNKLIVVNTSGQRVAFHVNDVQRIIPYEEQRLKSMDETNEYALGVYELDSSEQLIIVNTQTDIFLKGEKTYDSDYRL